MSTGLDNFKIYSSASELELKVFELTKKFPLDEKFRSVDQLRRSSSSVSNNIAEGYNRKPSKEKIRIFRDIVKGEAEETKRNLYMCLRKEFHNDSDIIEKYTELLKMISGYVKFLERKLTNL